jgi:hypothetical protein
MNDNDALSYTGETVFDMKLMQLRMDDAGLVTRDYEDKSHLQLVRGKLSYLAGFTQHLVDFAQVGFFFGDHLARVLLK